MADQRLTADNWVPVENGAAHEDHSVPGHRRRRRVVDVVHFEDDLAVRSHRNAIAVSQCQSLIVVEDRVKILYPDGVDWAIQKQPDMIALQCKGTC